MQNIYLSDVITICAIGLNEKDCDFYADGINDSIYIQEAINLLNERGRGGVIKLSKGVFYLDIIDPLMEIIKLYNNISILGDESGGTILKIKNNVGGYKAIVGNLSDDLSNINIKNIVFDHNVQNNFPLSLSNLILYPRHTFITYRGENIVFKNNIIKNEISINTFVANGVDVKNVFISENKFIGIGYNSDVYQNDHSTIYINGKNINILNNIFESLNWNTRTAIETHSSNVIVSNNYINGYLNGINITGVMAEDSVLNNFINNIIDVAQNGIIIWSLKYNEHISGFGLKNLIIENNNINVRQFTKYNGVGSIGGIVFSGNNNLPIENININNNNICFEEENEVPSYIGNNQSVGIGGYISNADFYIKNININNNSIYNAPVSGIRLAGYTIMNGNIYNNFIVNPGQTLTNVVSGYKKGIFIAIKRSIGLLNIEHNKIIDCFEITRLPKAFFIGTAEISNTIELKYNCVRIYGLNRLCYTGAYEIWNDISIPLIYGDDIEDFITITKPCKKGSIIIDIKNFRRWVLQETGTSWSITNY